MLVRDMQKDFKNFDIHQILYLKRIFKYQLNRQFSMLSPLTGLLSMSTPEECFHPELTFGSGDYYIFCNRCGRKWATMGNHEEYGHDSQGLPIGADPTKANQLKDMSKLLHNRVLLNHE
jgi:hypothetical protein